MSFQFREQISIFRNKKLFLKSILIQILINFCIFYHNSTKFCIMMSTIVQNAQVSPMFQDNHKLILGVQVHRIIEIFKTSLSLIMK